MNKHIAGRQGDTKAIGKANGYSLSQLCYFCRTFQKLQSFGFISVEDDDFSFTQFNILRGVSAGSGVASFSIGKACPLVLLHCCRRRKLSLPARSHSCLTLCLPPVVAGTLRC